LKCDFCGKITEIPTALGQGDRLPNEPEAIVPMTVDFPGMDAAINRELNRRGITNAVISMKERLYVPFYASEGDFSANWTASFGYDREESYATEESGKYDPQLGRRPRVRVLRHRTTTDWTPVSGVTAGTFAVLCYGSKSYLGTDISIDSYRGTIAQMFLNTYGYGTEHDGYGFEDYEGPCLYWVLKPLSDLNCVRYDASYVVGISVKDVAIPFAEAFEPYGSKALEEQIENHVKQFGQGDQQSDWHWTSKITNKRSTLVLLPVCKAIVEINGQSHNVVMGGIDTSEIYFYPDLPEGSSDATASTGSQPANSIGKDLPRRTSRLHSSIGAVVLAVIVFGCQHLFRNAGEAKPATGAPSSPMQTQEVQQGGNAPSGDPQVKSPMMEKYWALHNTKPYPAWEDKDMAAAVDILAHPQTDVDRKAIEDQERLIREDSNCPNASCIITRIEFSAAKKLRDGEAKTAQEALAPPSTSAPTPAIGVDADWPSDPKAHWPQEFRQRQYSDCARAYVQQGNPQAAPICRCLVDKASIAIPVYRMAQLDGDQEVQVMVQGILASCR
jgi:hypothetical protein